MVFTPKRRHLVRVFCLVLLYTGFSLLFLGWNTESQDKYEGLSDNYGTGKRRWEFSLTEKKINKVKRASQVGKRAIVFSETNSKPNTTWVHHPWTNSLRGFLNVHVWLDWCGSTVSDLRRNIHFPKYPDVRLKTKIFHLSHDAYNYGQRVFGYLHPSRTGHYTFAISSDDSSELWLSTDDEPKNAQLIAWVGNLSDPLWQDSVADGEFTKYKSQISRQVFLLRMRRYFVEALHKQSSSKDHLLVAWKTPKVANFSYITSSRISRYIHPDEVHDVNRYARHIPLSPAVLQEPRVPQKLWDQIPVGILNRGQSSGDKVPKYHSLATNFGKMRNIISDVQSLQALAPLMYNSCNYKPSYRVDFNVSRFEGVYLIHETAVYPDDGTHFKHVEEYKYCEKTRLHDSHGEMLPGLTRKPQYFEPTLDDLSTESTSLDPEAEVDTFSTDKTVEQNNFQTKFTFNKRKILTKLTVSHAGRVTKNIQNQLKICHSNNNSKQGIDHSVIKNVRKEMSFEKCEYLHRKRNRSDKLSINSRVSRKKKYRQQIQNKNKRKLKKELAKADENGKFKVIFKPKRDDKYPVAWHQVKPTQTRDIFVEETSPIAETLRKLKRTGLWNEIKAYARRKRLLLTHKTWMYVTWKFLRYVKPKRQHDKLVEFIYKQNLAPCRTDGNILLNGKVVKGVVNRYLKDLQKHYGSKVYVKRIVNVEENHDVFKGDRYLIELDIGLHGKSESLFISDYVYWPLGAQSFCSPREFFWKKNVTVHVIVPVKDLGKWVQHFIDDMSELYEATLDDNVNVIIVDFNSSDIDIELALKRSSLKRYRVLRVNGSFQRALGIQIGADAVKNPDDIIFTCDLHLEFPNNIIQVIRKHCVRGKMAFSPMVLRLDCGFTPSLPYGEWETIGYGLFAIYKSDFDRIGGMNIDEFKTKWGGEDWEIVDRCLQKGMEIERLRVPKFYHFFHSKQGMWGSYGFEDSVSGELEVNIGEDELVPGYYFHNVARYGFNQALMPG